MSVIAIIGQAVWTKLFLHARDLQKEVWRQRTPGEPLNADFFCIWYTPIRNPWDRNEDGIHPQVEELEGLTNVTIFLPSLEAFSQLPEPFIEMLAVEPANLLEFMLRQEGNSMRTLVVAVLVVVVVVVVVVIMLVILRHVGSPMTTTASLTNGLILESEVKHYKFNPTPDSHALLLVLT